MSQNPIILAIETSSRIGSVAVAFGGKIQKELVFSKPMKHSEEIFPAISTLLESIGRKPRQIEHIYISAGPGSFTGLRIATTLAKAMHLANKTKVIAVDTLDVIASNIMDLISENIDQKSQSGIRGVSIDTIATVLDAKRGQFFIAVYNRLIKEVDTNYTEFNKQYAKILPASLLSASEFLERFACKEKPVWLLGDGLVYHREKFRADGILFLEEKYWSPRANKVLLLGWQMAQQSKFAEPISLTPFYMSRPDVTIKSR